MTGAEAYLIARMQAALVCEGILHNVRGEGQLEDDQELIKDAVTQAWDELPEWDRRMVRHWRRT